MEMETRYNPQEVEAKWHDQWNRNQDFTPKGEGKPFSMVIPPPNVTGALHLGHALNNTIQDILVRYRRKTGRDTLWIPGTDHAGIATQAVVEKRLFQDENKTRHDIGRDALVERIWKWKDEYEARITTQLKSLGISCDWTKQRFTLDPICAKAVRHAFFNLFKKGLIYRGKRLVNWDTKLQTAVADDEIYYENVKGHFWTFKYPLADGSGFIPVSTTRPETIMGDTALAVHPNDERYAKFIGKTLKVPFVNREIPVIADAILVDKDFGTGSVKVTPAHDPNDYATGLRHKLPMINIMNDDGSLNENAGPFKGLKGVKAREAVVQGLEDLGLLIKVEDHEMSVGHSDRSKTVIEPYLSDQWFVKMDTLAENAMQAVTSGQIKIIPERYANKYLDWLKEKRDWCISRQLWWGHRIPIWHTDAKEADLKNAFGNRDDIYFYQAENGSFLVCSKEENLKEDSIPGYKLIQEEDVLDTWFSSGLWPHSTMGWPEQTETLKKYYPTSVLVTSRDIITLWVARMVLFSQENMGQVPFETVYIHPKILDGNGQTMSKSKGNGVDPMDIEKKYGTDALRFVMASLCTDNQDVRLPVKKEKQADGSEINISEKFEIGRNFSNKLWNACRFLYPHLNQLTEAVFKTGQEPEAAPYALEDKWILSRLQTTIKDATRMLEEYRFAELTGFLYHFVWDNVCSQYLEIKKAVINSETLSKEKVTALHVLSNVLHGIIQLLHPVMPFITEELNQILFPGTKRVILSEWPHPEDSLIDVSIEKAFDNAFAIVENIRAVRGRYNVSPATKLNAVLSVTSETDKASTEPCLGVIKELGGLNSLTLEVKAQKPKFSASSVIPGGELYIPLEGILDPNAEITRLQKEIERAKGFVASLERKLSNEKFVKGAPEAVVNAERQKLATQNDIIEKSTKALEELTE